MDSKLSQSGVESAATSLRSLQRLLSSFLCSNDAGEALLGCSLSIWSTGAELVLTRLRGLVAGIEEQVLRGAVEGVASRQPRVESTRRKTPPPEEAAADVKHPPLLSESCSE